MAGLLRTHSIVGTFRRFVFPLGVLVALTTPVVVAAETRVQLKATEGPDGRMVELKPPDRGATVLIFYSSECPISNGYSPTLNQIAAGFPAERVRFVGVCVDTDLSSADVLAHAKDFGLKFPVLHDPKGTLGRQLGAKITPEAFVVDTAGEIRYYGRIDDLYPERGKQNAHPETHELKDAVASVLERREVKVKHAEAVGCPIPEPIRPASDKVSGSQKSK